MDKDILSKFESWKIPEKQWKKAYELQEKYGLYLFECMSPWSYKNMQDLEKDLEINCLMVFKNYTDLSDFMINFFDLHKLHYFDLYNVDKLIEELELNKKISFYFDIETKKIACCKEIKLSRLMEYKLMEAWKEWNRITKLLNP